MSIKENGGILIPRLGVRVLEMRSMLENRALFCLHPNLSCATNAAGHHDERTINVMVHCLWCTSNTVDHNSFQIGRAPKRNAEVARSQSHEKFNCCQKAGLQYSSFMFFFNIFRL